jgi:ABC-type multidrug transport system fused ATPase/permease subunit
MSGTTQYRAPLRKWLIPRPSNASARSVTSPPVSASGVYLTAHTGGLVCMLGRTGMAKSTILALLLRRYSLAVGRQRIALVSSNPWLMDGTVAQNIAVGCPHSSRVDVEEAGEIALGRRFIAGLPDGYDTIVGVGGIALSDGQRWRLALARAALRQADVLLLDEPTRGLAPDGERAVMDAIDRAADGRIALVVSHRLRLTARADRVRVMTGRDANGTGVPSEVIALGRAFAGWRRADLAEWDSTDRAGPNPDLVSTR